MTVLAKIH